MTPKYEKNQAYAVEYIKSCIRLNLFLARLFFKQFLVTRLMLYITKRITLPVQVTNHCLDKIVITINKSSIDKSLLGIVLHAML